MRDQKQLDRMMFHEDGKNRQGHGEQYSKSEAMSQAFLPAEEFTKTTNAAAPTAKNFAKQMPSPMPGAGDEFPQSPFSMWYPEMIGIAQNRQDFKKQMAAAYMDVRSAPYMYATTRSLWMSVKHGWVMAPAHKEKISKGIDKMKSDLQTISDAIRSGKKIDSDMYYAYIDNAVDTWELIFEGMNKLQLLINFGKREKWLKSLEQAGRNPSKIIVEEKIAERSVTLEGVDSNGNEEQTIDAESGSGAEAAGQSKVPE